MEQTMLISLLISSLFLVPYSVRAFYSIWWKPKMLEKYLKLQGINGTPYKLSFGDMKEYVKQITEAWSKPASLNHHIVSRVDPFTHNIVQTYGKMSMFWLGATPRLNVMEPELVKEVLSNKLGHFQKPSINPHILILTNGLTTLEGEKWAAHRRIINPAFHLDKLKGMLLVISDSCGALVERWKKSVGVDGTCEMDVWPEFQGLAGDIISRTAFGSNYAEGNKILELQRELLVLVLESMQTLYVPGFRFLPTKKNKKRQSLNKKITSMLRALVERKDAAMSAGESPRDDLLGLLLQSNNVSNTESYKMSIEEIIEECKQFYLAGHETTSSLLTWTMIVLAMHPDWQEKAREEVLRVYGKRNPTYEAMHQLKNITMILYEVQRLYPPVIALYLHTRKETKIGNISLPAGVDITLPILHIHHDPELWGNAVEEFKPERFSEGVAKASKDKLAFFPFGWGPRTCIGQQFATIEVKVALVVILQNFSFKLSASYTHAPNTGMTLQPQHGAQITLYQL